MVNLGKSTTDKQAENYETCYKEHLLSFRSNNTNYKFAEHLLENGQAFGKTDDIMEIKHFGRKVAHMGNTERFFIYEDNKKGNQLNNKNTVSYNKNLWSNSRYGQSFD